ncbi:MAG: succinate dehydrogenase [Planctomycetota bacterium]|nr:MAG: succinate dehydrogenase [Planctomycetota bacterium]
MAKLFQGSVGKKISMSLTGLFLCLFLVVHLSGNLLLLKNDGGVAFNQYSEFMSTNPLIRISEIILAAAFLVHIITAILLSLQNQEARPDRYVLDRSYVHTSFASRTMIYTGSLVFIFLVIHLKTFFVPHRLFHSEQTMYQTVKLAFENPFYTGFYVVAMVLLTLHLWHGFQSAFQSLGLRHRRYTPLIEKLGMGFSILIPLGFGLIPLYFFFRQFLK